MNLQCKDSSIIGLFGIGGVGKTTLLKQLNNEFLKTGHGFDLVVWIVVSKPANLGRIQDTLRRKLNVVDHLWENKNESERAILIFSILKRKKFVILLDDLWDRLELLEVGIPHPCVDNMSRVVFTTRSQEVCRSMDAHKFIKVNCLPPDQALNLFYSKVGEEMLRSHPEIQEFVEDVASECDGLPLALITIGRSMRGKTDVQQWKDAKRMLEHYPSTFPGMKGRVFSKLVFSYDNLPNPTLQKCFEYCSIFPEDYEIEKETLIRLSVAEGIIHEYDDTYHALIQGRQLIESLMQACLLEVGETETTVKMHDVIRDMALWLACERGEKKNKFLVDVVSRDDGPSTAHNAMAKWKNAEKVSVWGSGTTMKCLDGLTFCSNLITLIIRNTDLMALPGEIFQSLKTVKVLDLSDNKKLLGLPTRLTDLFGGIGDLVNLEYLNIIGTSIRSLPAEVEQLKQLRFLLLSHYTIAGKVISSLPSLETFEQDIDYGCDIDNASKQRATECEMLAQLQGLKHIMDLCLVIRSVASIQILVASPKLQSCIRRLSLMSFESLSAVVDLSTGRSMEHLERLQIVSCDMSGIRLRSSPLSNLRHVSITSCNKIRHVTWLVFVPNLCTLLVEFCESIEELIGEDVEETSGRGRDTFLLFSSLTSLHLTCLPKLRSICPQSALSLPSLKEMKVYQCKSLEKLPFDSNTATTTPQEFKIKGEREWWDGLKWETQPTKDAFTPKYQPWG